MVVNLTGDGLPLCTPSNTVNDPKGPFLGLFILNAGTVNFQDAQGNSPGTSDSLPAGTIIPGKVVRVNSTGTTATVCGITGVA